MPFDPSCEHAKSGVNRAIETGRHKGERPAGTNEEPGLQWEAAPSEGGRRWGAEHLSNVED
jgi:hypothetical protein